MLLTAAASASHGPPLAAVCVAGVLCLVVLVPIALTRRAARKTRRMLERCPRCGGRAVRRMHAEAVDGMRARVAVECGQCDTWRRAVVDDDCRRAQERRLTRDRARIQRLLTAAEQEEAARVTR